MKIKKLLILALLAVAAGSCGNAPKKAAENIEIADTVQTKTAEKQSIEGQYTNSDDTECEILLTISKTGNRYFYVMQLNDTTYKGNVSLSDNEITFEGIEWAEYDGELNEDGEPIKDDLKLPVGIGGQIDGNTIEIQNYGNAMNSYLKLNCGDKYIILAQKQVENDEDVICDAYQEDGEPYIEECTYLRKNLREVYNIVKKTTFPDDLKQELPVADIQYKPENSEIDTIKYRYKSEKHLLIVVSGEYQGLRNSIEIIETENSTTAKIIRKGGN